MASDELERAQAQLADGNALKAYVEAGMPLEIAVQEVWGWSESARRSSRLTGSRPSSASRQLSRR
jgi:hypothetical protein